jgi:hypothetical protein
MSLAELRMEIEAWAIAAPPAGTPTRHKRRARSFHWRNLSRDAAFCATLLKINESERYRRNDHRGCEVKEVMVNARETMFVLDGGPDAHLPQESGGPVVAGPQAIFVAGRVSADSTTLVRIGPSETPSQLVKAYEGDLETPHRTLRLLNVTGEVILAVQVHDVVTRVRIYLTDLEEPDEIFVAVENIADDR